VEEDRRFGEEELRWIAVILRAVTEDRKVRRRN
jgi:hypothetical protein